MHSHKALKAALLLLVSTTSLLGAAAENTSNTHSLETDVIYKAAKPVAEAPAWSFAVDNDLLVPGGRDQDYTYGLSATVSGKRGPLFRLTPDRALATIDRLSGLKVLNSKTSGEVYSYSTEIGLYGFTPENIENAGADSSDRPYAGLAYISSSREYRDPKPDVTWRSTLTIGVLGLDLVGDLQNEVHAITGSDAARGWDNQISDGGELTARYSIARQRLWETGLPNVELKTSVQGSIGYLTELSYGFSVRIGKIATRWQSFNPELASYREHSVPVVSGRGFKESYFSAGMSIKARAYNVFLQGQFKNNAVEYGGGDVNHSLFEAWVGYTHIFANGYRISYNVRGHSSELKQGIGDRTVLWGGLTVAKNY